MIIEGFTVRRWVGCQQMSVSHVPADARITVIAGEKTMTVELQDDAAGIRVTLPRVLMARLLETVHQVLPDHPAESGQVAS